MAQKMLRHLHEMVPAVGPVKRKRKADHHRHSSSTSLCKRPAPPRHELDLPFDRACSLHGPGLPNNAGAVDRSSPRRGDVNGSNLHCCPGELLFVEDETTSTDDESEFSSMDGRSSPSHPLVPWGPGPGSNQGAPSFVKATTEYFQTPLSIGFPTPRAVETPTAATATTAVSTRGRRVCSGIPTGASCLYGGAPINIHRHHHHHQQQQQLAQEEEEETYASLEQQEQHQGQDHHGKRQVQDGGRSDADVWGWFVDAGEDQPSRTNVQNGEVRYY